MTISNKELVAAIDSARDRGYSEGEIIAALAGLAAKGVRSDRTPICEECDEEMHRFEADGNAGWSCDSCGWSWDD
jgi:tRNA(Ile2) C34 agmatinyltransferase TiaS